MLGPLIAFYLIHKASHLGHVRAWSIASHGYRHNSLPKQDNSANSHRLLGPPVLNLQILLPT